MVGPPRTWTEKGQIGKIKVNDPLKQGIQDGSNPFKSMTFFRKRRMSSGSLVVVSFQRELGIGLVECDLKFTEEAISS